MKKYRIQRFKGNIYEVIELKKLVVVQSWDDSYQDVSVFQGTISECESYIRIKHSG